MKKKEKTLFVLALLLLVGLTSGYIAKTYAKYASKLEDKSGTVTVAKWNFRTENQETNFTIKLPETVKESSLVNGKIAPGTEGSFDIKLLNATTETGVKFTITLNNINVPTNLKLYKDADHQNALPTNGKITGYLKAKDEDGGVSVPIYWAWAYGESDNPDSEPNTQDTQAGEAAAGAADAAEAFTIGFSIVGVQTDPKVEVAQGVENWTE